MLKDKEFTFQEKGHIYKLGDERLPSVSEILSPLSDYSSVPPERLRVAQEYGKAVHKAIALWLKNDLDETTLDEALKRPLEAFVKWYDTIDRVGLLAVERPLYHKKLKYAGTPDIVTSEMIVDIKTRKFNKTTDIVQLVAYSKLVSDFPLKGLFVLELDVNGNYKFVNAQNNEKQAWGIFRKLLDNYRSNQEVQTIIKNWKEMR